MIAAITILFKWVPAAREWHVESVRTSWIARMIARLLGKGGALQEFKDREEIRDFFVGCSKDKPVVGKLYWKESGPITLGVDAQMQVNVTWDEGFNKWILRIGDKEIGKLFNCDNIGRVFRGITKERTTTGWLGWRRGEEDR